MKTQKKIQAFRFTQISGSDLSEIRAGTVPLAAAAVAIAAGKLLLDGSYCLGYAIGYIQGRFD